MGMAIDVTTPGGLVLALLPEIVLTGWMLVLLIAVAWRHRDEGDQQVAGQLALMGLVSTLLVVIWMWVKDAYSETLTGMIALALVSSVSAMIMAGPRVYESMGNDYPRIAALRNSPSSCSASAAPSRNW